MNIFFQNIFVHKLDLSDTSSIYKFAEKYKDEHGKLDVLVSR